MPHRKGNFKGYIKVKCACGYEMMRQKKTNIQFICVDCKTHKSKAMREYDRAKRLSPTGLEPTIDKESEASIIIR